jgi:hypothetical protein
MGFKPSAFLKAGKSLKAFARFLINLNFASTGTAGHASF